MRFGRVIWIGAVAALFVWFLSWNPKIIAAQSSFPNWSNPIQLSTRNTMAWAPVLAADSAGNVHLVWSQTITNNPPPGEGDTLFYARWDGIRWTEPIDVLVSPGGGAAEWPELVVAPDGMLHLVWGTGGQNSRLMYSRAPVCCANNPARWLAPVALNLPILQSPAIASDSSGRLHIVFSSQENGSVMYRRSDDGGSTWSTPVEISDTRQSSQYTMYPRIAVDNRGRVHVAWTIMPWPGHTVMYARSDDGGQTWNRSRIIDSIDRSNYSAGFGPIYIDVAAHGNDEVHLMWDGAPTVERHHIFSLDGGKTWSTPTTVFPGVKGGGRAGWNNMAWDSAGVLHATSLTSNAPPVHAQWIRSSWSASQPIVTSGPGATGGELVRMVISRGNMLNVVWSKKDVPLFSVWYSRAQTSSPELPVVVPPTPKVEPTPTPKATSTSAIARTRTATPTSVPLYTDPPSSDVNPLVPVYIGVLPALLLVGLTLFITFRLRR